MNDKLLPRCYVVIVRLAGQYAAAIVAAYSAADAREQMRLELDTDLTIELGLKPEVGGPLPGAVIVRIAPSRNSYPSRFFGRAALAEQWVEPKLQGRHVLEQIGAILEIVGETRRI
jgi:hypothetical protein